MKKTNIEENKVRTACDQYIGQCLAKDLVDFKADGISQISKAFPKIDPVYLESIYDEEYRKWSDAYCE